MSVFLYYLGADAITKMHAQQLYTLDIFCGSSHRLCDNAALMLPKFSSIFGVQTYKLQIAKQDTQ